MANAKINVSSLWYIVDDTFVRGAAFLEGELQKGESFGRCFDRVQTFSNFIEIISKLNGFFSVIVKRSNKMYVAVDHVRSIPLFYASRNGEFFLSDNAEWIRDQVDARKMDTIACEEFQLTGYVTGQDTLFPEVKQLQAGQALFIDLQPSQPCVKTHRYYRFLHSEPDKYDECLLLKRLEQVTQESIERLIKYANGRQIVVPLSGGYDSRLIVTFLRRLGYTNVLTFSYGAKGNREARISKQVAESLGYPWLFIEYTSKKWKSAWGTEERLRYQTWASGLTSLPHIQDWLAVRELKQKRQVDPNCVFVPGHAGDFVAGSHIPSDAFEKSYIDIHTLANAVLKHHYLLAPKKLLMRHGEHLWKERILTTAEVFEVKSGVDLANYFEKWDWQERQAKFIVNSVRVYEFYGYDWWLPLWDVKFVRFWQEVPLVLRKERRLYISFVRQIYAECVGEPIEKSPGHSSDYSAPLKLIRKILNVFPRYWTLPIRQLIIDQTQNKLLTPLMDFDTLWLLLKGYRINGIYVKRFLDEHKRGY